MASSQPPPRAKPATAATVGLRARESASQLAVRHLLDVGPGRERLLGAGYDHAGDVGIALERLHGLRQLRDQRCVERIERLRPVEPDDPDLAAGLDDDVLISHWLLPATHAGLA
jgi:hypothetical protein